MYRIEMMELMYGVLPEKYCSTSKGVRSSPEQLRMQEIVASGIKCRVDQEPGEGVETVDIPDPKTPAVQYPDRTRFQPVYTENTIMFGGCSE